ncbi:MAG: ATP-binding protein [Butyrivibrio sp.]|uniref:AAA family ATPase n=1 Tax=Butyrivibrio sp. TaxID=28121 RepID=UPI0025FB7E40|nr:AAA family ATPase [Butyrivibrio sp.]MCR5770852.1 ATP-binding protein [Butyrivibrio sp.]
MELVYLYVEHLGMCIDKTGINFSKNYEVTYDSKHRDLKIEKKNNPNRINIYGDNIQDINVLVGKNGIGKSTIMRLLGLPERDRIQYFSYYNNKQNVLQGIDANIWVAIYHLYDDTFAIEGYWFSFLKNFVYNEPEFKPADCIMIRYDFENSKILEFKPINKLKDSRFNIEKLFYVYFQNNTGVNWFNDYTPKDNYDISREYLFRRFSCNASSYESVTKYLVDSYRDANFSAKMGSKPGTEIDIRLAYVTELLNKNNYNEETENTIDKYELVAKRIYGRNVRALQGALYLGSYDSDIVKQRFIIAFLETIVYSYLYDIDQMEESDVNEYAKTTPYDKTSEEKDTYNSRKNYLLEELKYYEKSEYIRVVLDIVKELENIPNRYYVRGETISIPISELEPGKLDGLMQIFDRRGRIEVSFSDKSILEVTFSNMSSGEANFINVFASIHGALQTRTSMAANPANPGEQTCILLLDEPDMSFHPEWSRTFIDNLTYFLNNSYKDINFQVIITTHSPLMLSDIQSDSIYCLGKDDEGNLTVSNPKYGLLSGINDILIDGFFTESLFGKFAEGFADGIVTRLNELEENIDKWQIDKDDFDEEYKDLSNRIDILGGGLIKDSLMQRLTMAKKWFYMRNGYDQD